MCHTRYLFIYYFLRTAVHCYLLYFQYNLNNKRMESLVRKIINKNEVPEVMNIRNPECLKFFVDVPEITSYNQDFLESKSNGFLHVPCPTHSLNSV